MQLFAIFGHPVKHSKSPLMHNMVFKTLGIKACYMRIDLQDGSQLRKRFFSLALDGANITVPHKEEAFRACDEVRGFAKKVGVVNTIVREGEKLIGYNTDADGFMFAIEKFAGVENILVLGAGGTAKALVQKFLDEGKSVTLLNRTKARLEEFSHLHVNRKTWEDFAVESYDLVVNTTSAGLTDELLPAPKEMLESIIANTQYVADVIYGKLTPFLQLAKNNNLLYKDGADMLLGQGVLANELFLHGRYDKEKIYNAMKKSFEL